MHIGVFLAKAAARFPQNIAVVHGDTRLTTKELLGRVYQIANALRGLGLRKGERVALLLTNSHHSVECFYGIVCAGLVVIPMNYRNSAKEHLYVLNHSEARAIMVGEEFAEDIESILPEVPTVAHSVCVPRNAPESMYDYEELLSKSSNYEPEVEIGEEDIISLRYTSGTTGPPKGVIHDHRSNIAILYNMLMDDFKIEEGDSIAIAGPITHASGFMVLPHIVRGAKVVILPKFDPKGMLETIEREQVTTLYLVPTMIAKILAQPDLGKYDLSSLKTIRYGASPISPEVLKRAIDVFGNIFVQAYGLTEGGMLLTLLSKEDHVLDGTEKSLRRLHSIGREVTSVLVRIMNEQRKIVPPGEIGEIVVQSDQDMRGYLKDPDATANALCDGWLHTGDMCYTDDDGYIYLLDRKEDMIISGGFNIYPKEVEDVLHLHPAVLEAAVFGIPDDVWGEVVKAIVSLKPGMTATEEELIEHCKEHLANYKRPKSVEFIRELPKNPYGKVLRRKLKEPYWTGRARMVN